VLGVPRDADAEALKKAFRQLARRYHPDTGTEPGPDRWLLAAGLSVVTLVVVLTRLGSLAAAGCQSPAGRSSAPDRKPLRSLRRRRRLLHAAPCGRSPPPPQIPS